MRRGGTTLVVLVVAAIALAAGFDALRGGRTTETVAESEPPSSPPTTTFEVPTEEEAPLADQLGGTLYYTDGSCELQAIELLGEGAVDPPNWDECRFVLSPNGRRVSGAGTGWDPYSDPLIGRIFETRDGTIQVSTNAGPEGEPFAGTAPAWRQDGTLTYFTRGALREWPSGEDVLSQYALREALRRSSVPGLAGFRRVRVREAAWLDERRLAAILDVEGPSGSWDVLTSFDGQTLEEPYVETLGRFADLRASPGGTYFAARRGQDDLLLAEPGRGELSDQGIVGYRAITWSPDDRWVAVAAEGGVFVFRPEFEGPPALELDLDARDLDWRGELGPDAVAAQLDTEEASAWLERAGAGGRLLVTEQEGGTCRLRALEIPGLEWAEAPPESEGFCRFTVEPDGLIHPGGVAGIAATPAGRPTYVADGELFAGNPGDDRSELLVSAEMLEEIFGAPAGLEEVAWVDEERFWAVVRSEVADRIALMTTGALVYAPWFAAPTIEGLRVGPGGLVAASSDRGVPLLGDDGRRLILTNGLDVAWAPGEPIAAVSTRDGILFVDPATGRSVSLPLEVRDLEWVAG